MAEPWNLNALIFPYPSAEVWTEDGAPSGIRARVLIFKCFLSHAWAGADFGRGASYTLFQAPRKESFP